MTPVDNIALNFSPATLNILNVILGIVMFGVALDMRLEDFQRIASLPRSAVVGLVGQFFILPALTYVLILLIRPAPSVGLGMVLVASCPGGNISNFFTYLAKGNTALSVSMSAISTACAIFMTPLNFAFWGARVPGATPILEQVAINPLDMAITIFVLLGLPLALGMYLQHRHTAWANKAKRPLKIFSMIFFLAFVVIALAGNWANFVNYINLVFVTVLLQNGLALAIGYFGARWAALPEADRRAVAIEVGIQNSGLGLILIFNFFGGLGGMAIIAAWWGIWHIVTGYSLGLYWGRREPTDLRPRVIGRNA